MAATKRQKGTIGRIERVDPTATHREVGDLIVIAHTPRWELGRHSGGMYRENPNPQRLTHVITPDGRIHGWGFGPSVDKLKLPADVKVTTAESMAAALKARAEARKPEPNAVEERTPKTEPKATTRKTRTRKTSTRKTGAKA